MRVATKLQGPSPARRELGAGFARTEVESGDWRLGGESTVLQSGMEIYIRNQVSSHVRNVRSFYELDHRSMN